MSEEIIRLITSITSGGVAGGVIIYLSRSWLSERLKGSISHEYQMKLESHKAELKAEQQVAIEKIKLESEKENAIRSSAQELLSTSRQASHEIRIEAVQCLWKSFLELKSSVPTYIQISDFLKDEEWDQFNNHPPLMEMLDGLSIESIAKTITGSSIKTDELRPFIGELLYSYFFTFRALLGAIMYGFLDGKEKGNIVPWQKIERNINMLVSALGKETVDKIMENKIANFQNLQDEFEKRIIEHSAKIVSGEESATFGLEQASAINSKASELLAASQPNN